MQDVQRQVAESMRQIQDDESLRATAARDQDAALDQLGLKGIARQAVAAGLTLALSGAALAGPKGIITGAGWWG